jgi:hypothetical protein
MFSVITNAYNKKIKGSTLIELFTPTGKLKKVKAGRRRKPKFSQTKNSSPNKQNYQHFITSEDF